MDTPECVEDNPKAIEALAGEQVAGKPDPGSPTCITEGCGKERQWKGLCRSCYGQARRLIDEKKTTWEALEDLGMIVQDDKPFLAEFKRRKKQKEEAERKA